MASVGMASVELAWGRRGKVWGYTLFSQSSHPTLHSRLTQSIDRPLSHWIPLDPTGSGDDVGSGGVYSEQTCHRCAHDLHLTCISVAFSLDSRMWAVLKDRDVRPAARITHFPMATTQGRGRKRKRYAYSTQRQLE